MLFCVLVVVRVGRVGTPELGWDVFSLVCFCVWLLYFFFFFATYWGLLGKYHTFVGLSYRLSLFTSNYRVSRFVNWGISHLCFFVLFFFVS